jgi:hypothetical protein
VTDSRPGPRPGPFRPEFDAGKCHASGGLLNQEWVRLVCQINRRIRGQD